MLIDTHCHLDVEPLGQDVPGVLDRACRAAVTRIVVPAYDTASWLRIQTLAAAHPGVVFPALGLHPWVAHEPLDLADLAAGLRACGAVAIGEVGLDGKIDGPPLSAQIPVLERQLELACDLDLPVILHCRGAFDELAAVLQRFEGSVRGVLHAFSRGPDLADRFLRLGLYLGFGGAVTRPRAAAGQAVVAVPFGRIVLETDAPSIGLEGIPARLTEPRHVADIAAAVATLRGVGATDVAAATSAAAAQLFNLPPA